VIPGYACNRLDFLEIGAPPRGPLPLRLALNLLLNDCQAPDVRRHMGAALSNEKKEFTLLECVIVVAILLFVAGIAAQKLVHSIKASEENTLHDAATQYLAVKNIYAEQSRAASAVTFSVNSASTESIFRPPAR